uniref:Replication protein A 70 kDa DNA-binding subunit B n=1 Tax=Tanacetum cinerariifolium TaxID=118510 RepID=A0A6L2LI63_TANCI|nr:replication protein A 70 kDa DNA-binding subunit B [Tanacetum cinerariifolium]
MDSLETQPSACVSFPTTTLIEYEEGWVCIACYECNCKAVPNDDESSCKKASIILISVKHVVRVSDDLACASFLMFDRDVFSIVDKSAYVLNEEEANKPNAADYPNNLNKLIGKTLLFRVYVSRYNLINNYVVYTVGRMSSSELHIKSFMKLYADEMAEVKYVNEDGYETDGDNKEPLLETTQNPKLETNTPSKDCNPEEHL